MLGLNQLILISNDKGQDCFLITDLLIMPFWTSLSSRVQYFSPVPFHFITHNLISELICFAFFVCMDYMGWYRHLVKINIKYKYKYKNIHKFPQMEDLSDLGKLNKKNPIHPQTTCSHTRTHEWQIIDITASCGISIDITHTACWTETWNMNRDINGVRE